jgi:hypothetical protein
VTFFLLAVVVLILVIAVLISVLAVVLILVVVLIAVAVLVIHNLLPSSFIFAVFRFCSMPSWSGFILWFEEKTDQ